MRVPIIVTCECGRTISADAGDRVVCECGKTYETRLSTQQVAALNSMQAQMRVFARLGIGLIGLLALAGFLEVGTAAGVVALCLGIVAWWVLLQPVWRRHVVGKLSALPPADISPL